jgi:hypothetical protein
MIGCNNTAEKIVPVRVGAGRACRIEMRSEKTIVKAFDDFYRDSKDGFFIKSFRLIPGSNSGKLVEQDIYIQADPKSFKAYQNVYGGRDNSHVYFQSTLLEGLHPGRVKVYSDQLNCANCDGYFMDGDIIYKGSEKINSPTTLIPKEYKFIE